MLYDLVEPDKGNDPKVQKVGIISWDSRETLNVRDGWQFHGPKYEDN